MPRGRTQTTPAATVQSCVHDNDMSDNSKVSEGEWKNYNNSEQCALNRHALFRRLRSALD